jgi:hypothetical protein
MVSLYNANNDMSFLDANASFFPVLCVVVSIIPAMRMSHTSAHAEKEA